LGEPTSQKNHTIHLAPVLIETPLHAICPNKTGGFTIIHRSPCIAPYLRRLDRAWGLGIVGIVGSNLVFGRPVVPPFHPGTQERPNHLIENVAISQWALLIYVNLLSILPSSLREPTASKFHDCSKL